MLISISELYRKSIEYRFFEFLLESQRYLEHSSWELQKIYMRVAIMVKDLAFNGKVCIS